MGIHVEKERTEPQLVGEVRKLVKGTDRVVSEVEKKKKQTGGIVSWKLSAESISKRRE